MYKQARERIVQIQALARSLIGRREFQKQQQAARVIQNFWRQVQQRRHEARVATATRIQAWWRMSSLRSRFLCMKKAVSTIENVWVAFKKRSQFLAMRAAAVRIQAFVRMVQAKKQYKKQVKQICVIQALARRRNAQNEFERQQKAVRLLQTAMRTAVAKKQAQKREAAAVSKSLEVFFLCFSGFLFARSLILVFRRT